MNTNKKLVIKTEDETGSHCGLQSLTHCYMSYIDLSSFLFGSKNPVYDINEIDKKNKFYDMAREMAGTLGIDWEHMNHADSNRIMLALLEDAYNAMAKVANTRNLAIKVILKVVKE